MPSSKMKSVSRVELERWLRTYLDVAAIPDDAQNGLQVEGRPSIARLALGVSASQGMFRRAVDAGADAVLVHHGLLWGKPERLVGPLFARVKLLVFNDLSLFAYHLPLDKHGEVGNNVQLLRGLGVKKYEAWGHYHDAGPIGCVGNLSRSCTIDEVEMRLNTLLGTRVRLFPYGGEIIRRVGAVSGGSAMFLQQAVPEGLDLFIGGEAGEFTQELAREAKVHVVTGGHYNTETLGVKALGRVIEKKFGIETFFIDIPNPV